MQSPHSAKVMSKLETLFQGYSDAGFIPRVIVLCGNFSSEPLGLSEGAVSGR